MADVRPQQAPADGTQDAQDAQDAQDVEASVHGAAPAKVSGAEWSEAIKDAEGVESAAAGARTRAVMEGRAPWHWQRPELVVARATLTRYYAGGWLACEALLAAALAVLLFWSADDAVHIFGSACVGLGLLGVVFAAMLAHGALNPQVRGPQVRAYGAGVYLRGLLLAAGLVRAGMCVLVVALALALGRIADVTAGNLVAGTTGLIALSVLVSTLIVVVSSPLTSRDERLVLLAALDGALFSLAGAGWVASVLAVLRVPLLPLVACYEVSVAGELSWGWLSALLLAGAYVAALAWLGERLLARAEGVADAADTEQGAEPVKP